MRTGTAKPIFILRGKRKHRQSKHWQTMSSAVNHWCFGWVSQLLANVKLRQIPPQNISEMKSEKSQSSNWSLPWAIQTNEDLAPSNGLQQNYKKRISLLHVWLSLFPPLVVCTWGIWNSFRKTAGAGCTVHNMALTWLQRWSRKQMSSWAAKSPQQLLFFFYLFHLEMNSAKRLLQLWVTLKCFPSI